MVVTAMIRVKPEVAAPAEERLGELVRAAASEEGVLVYSLHKDRKNPGVFFVYERYADREAFQRHGSMAHVQEFFKWVGPHLLQQPELTVFEEVASFVKGMPD
ncbi:antibiotic biosynthesis monooxygenase [Desulfobotulus sp. H1]|uniref:Antibiotic biosynthesis monooxygenase n=1 Tax=Desulfobotulus pelophilus TaxID=2823377 RepID=A0ABT3N6L3_9BACT|nr:putative quinol monooxygenase [Desulfobotulus pelophilus]MCW7753075.1 antibiotic biosynthesis monooxygenase [Desulfobotulus pelophilus]